MLVIVEPLNGGTKATKKYLGAFTYTRIRQRCRLCYYLALNEVASALGDLSLPFLHVYVLVDTVDCTVARLQLDVPTKLEFHIIWTTT